MSIRKDHAYPLFWKSLRVGLAMACAGALVGCTAPLLLAPAALDMAQLGTSAYARGELTTAYTRSFEDVMIAAQAMITELDIRVKRRIDKPGYLYVAATDLTDADIVIRIERRTARITKVSIRIGLLGDQALSTLIQDHIKTKLIEETGPGPRPTK